MNRVLRLTSVLGGMLFVVLFSTGDVRAEQARRVLRNFDYRGVTLNDGPLRRWKNGYP